MSNMLPSRRLWNARYSIPLDEEMFDLMAHWNSYLGNFIELSNKKIVADAGSSALHAEHLLWMQDAVR